MSSPTADDHQPGSSRRRGGPAGDPAASSRPAADPSATPGGGGSPQPPARGDASSTTPGASNDAAAASDTPAAPVAPPVPLTQQLGRIVVVVLAILFGVFAVANAQYVDFSWVFGETAVIEGADGDRLRGGVPLIVLLVASFVLGALVSGVAVWQIKRGRAHRRAARRWDKEHGDAN